MNQIILTQNYIKISNKSASVIYIFKTDIKFNRIISTDLLYRATHIFQDLGEDMLTIKNRHTGNVNIISYSTFLEEMSKVGIYLNNFSETPLWEKRYSNPELFV